MTWWYYSKLVLSMNPDRIPLLGFMLPSLNIIAVFISLSMSVLGYKLKKCQDILSNYLRLTVHDNLDILFEVI
jgi:hypothetical protein